MAVSVSQGRKAALRAGVTVLGNLAIDHVNDDPPSPGGCPSFSGVALGSVAIPGRIVTRAAAADMALFEPALAELSVPYDVLPANSTSSFGLRYVGEERTMTVDAIGPVWGAPEIEAADVDTTWVHVSPLLRSDFPVETLRLLKARGHLLGYDGQGLVRAPRTGELLLDLDFDPALLSYVTVLKVADDEADAIAGQAFDEASARKLGVPEILVTHGSGGCDVYLDGTSHHVAAARRIEGVHTTGAGDMFTVSYIAGRAAGHEPLKAAEVASNFVADKLQERRDGLGR